MSAKDKKKFNELSAIDKARHQKEMEAYNVTHGTEKKKKKREKDPNAPKRPQPAFFLFSSDERSKVRDEHPNWTVGEVAKELGHRWEHCKNRAKYETMAAAEKEKYEKAMAKYKAGN